jgi:ribosomal protein S27AE
MTTAEHPLCPTCGQPTNEGLADHAGSWECANEACPEFGQVVEAVPPGEFEGPQA